MYNGWNPWETNYRDGPTDHISYKLTSVTSNHKEMITYIVYVYSNSDM